MKPVFIEFTGANGKPVMININLISHMDSAGTAAAPRVRIHLGEKGIVDVREDLPAIMNMITRRMNPNGE